MNQTAEKKLQYEISSADALLIGAGAGLSTAAGFTYAGERFERYFSDFAAKYGFRDMYSGGFANYASSEERWAYWSRYIWINRYMDPPGSVYRDLYRVARNKDYFVLTTNVDHCFRKAGFDKRRLFYTQGDYGLFQCSEPCCRETFDNEETVRKMVLAQGYTIGENNALIPPEQPPMMTVPTELVPRCPYCGREMSMNLRADDTFVQDAGWDAALSRYEAFLDAHEKARIVYLEIGVGMNTPDIIKYHFWRLTYGNPNSAYACLNFDDAFAPKEIAARSVCLDGDSAGIIRRLSEA